MQNVICSRPRVPWSISWINFIYVILFIKIRKCSLPQWNRFVALEGLGKGGGRRVKRAQKSCYFRAYHLSKPNSDTVSKVQFPQPNLISLFSKSLPQFLHPLTYVYPEANPGSHPSPHTILPWLQSPAVPCICSSQCEIIIEWNASSYASEVWEWSSTPHCNYCSVEVT